VVSAFVTHAVDGFDDAIHEVAYKDKVAPRVHHKARLTRGEPLIKRRQRSAQIAGPIGVRKTEGNVVEAAQVNVLFTAGLADRIAAAIGVNPVIERDRLLHRLQTIAKCRLEIEQCVALWLFALHVRC